MKNCYLSYPWNTSLIEWYKRWFYIREEPGSATFCDRSSRDMISNCIMN